MPASTLMQWLPLLLLLVLALSPSSVQLSEAQGVHMLLLVHTAPCTCAHDYLAVPGGRHWAVPLTLNRCCQPRVQPVRAYHAPPMHDASV